MKRILAILCVIACLCGLCVPAMAAAVDLGGLNSLALVGTGVPGAADWTPGDAAGDFTKVSDGVYVKVIAVTAGHAMSFKVAGNDAWDDAYNFGGMEDGVTVALGTKIELANGGGSKDISLTAAKDGNLKFTVDLTGDVPTLLVEETDEEPTTNGGNNGSTDVPAGEKITVYAKFPADWKGACVWAWKEPGPVNATNAAWPGDLYLVEGEDGWWSVQVPNWITGLLINGNGGSVKTPDIKDFEVGKDLWINAYTDPQNPVYSHEEITDIVEPTTKPPVEATIRPTEGLKDNNQNNTENKGGKDLTVLLSIIGSVVLIAIAAVIVIIVKSKKKAA